MGFSTRIAIRFLRTQRSRFISLITVFAVLSITLGVMALDTTLAVMNGFRDQLQFTFVENMPMVTVMTQNAAGFTDLDELVDRLEGMDSVVGASPYIRKEGILSYERFPGRRPRMRGVVIWGIDPLKQGEVTSVLRSVDPPFADFSTDVFLGVEPDTPGIVLGRALAQGLRAGIGDVISITYSRPAAGVREYEAESIDVAIVGTVESGMYEFDNLFAYVDIDLAVELWGVLGGADGIGIKVEPMMAAPEIASAIADSLGSPPYFTNDWISLNSQLFEWIQLEKMLMFLLLSLITLVASFSVVAILLMMVRDRQRDIGIFMSMGVEQGQLVAVFVQLGLMIGGMGIALGSLLGFLLCRFLDSIGFPLPGDVYFIDTLPVHMKLADFGLVAGATLIMCYMATLLPSWLATRFTPVEVLRYE